MMLRTTRQMNNSTGLVWVNRKGSIRESAQAMKRASGALAGRQSFEEILVLRINALLKMVNASTKLVDRHSFQASLRT